MLNRSIRSAWLVGAWVAAVAIITVASIAMNANVSTTVLVFALAVAPGIVVGVLSQSAPPPTVAEILHSGETKAARKG